MNKYLLILFSLVACLAQGTIPSAYGFLWMNHPRSLRAIELKKTEVALRDLFENQHHIRLVKQHLSLGFSQQIMAYEQTSQDLRSINSDILDRLRNSYEGITGSGSDFLRKVEIQNQIIKKLPKFFFAPEIAQAKLLQALGYWKFQKKAQRHQIKFQEARELHPLSLVHLSEESKPVWWDAFELEVNAAINKNEESCPIQRDDWLRRGEKIWSNGFVLNEFPTRINPGIFLFIFRAHDGKWYEKLALCRQGRPIALHQVEWTPLRQHLRLDQGLDASLVQFQNLILLSYDQSKVNTYLYSPREGLRPWNEDVVMAREQPHSLNLNAPSFPQSEPPKWYNKTAIWAVAAVVLSGAITWTVHHASPDPNRAAVQVKILGGP